MAANTSRVASPGKSNLSKLDTMVAEENSESLMHMIFQYLNEESPNSSYFSPKPGLPNPRNKQWGAQLNMESPGASTSSESPLGSFVSDFDAVPSTRASSIESIAPAAPVSKEAEAAEASVSSWKPSMTDNSQTSMLATITSFTETLPEYLLDFTPSPKTPAHKDVSNQDGIKIREGLQHLSTEEVEDKSSVSKLNNAALTPPTSIMDRTVPRRQYATASKLTPALKINTDLARPKPNCLVIKDLRDKNGQTVQIESRTVQDLREGASPQKQRFSTEVKKPVLPTSQHFRDQLKHLSKKSNGHLQDQTPKVLRITNPDPPAASPIQTTVLPDESESQPSKKRPSSFSTLRKALLKPRQAPSPIIRQSEYIPTPSRKMLGNLEKHDREWNRLSMPLSSGYNPALSSQLRERDRNFRLREPPVVLRPGYEEKPLTPSISDSYPAPRKLYQLPSTPIIQKPERKPIPTAITRSGILDRFTTGDEILQMKMSRRVSSRGFETMEWDILLSSTSASLSPTRLLKCLQTSHSRSLRKDFLDSDGSRLFKLERTVGSARTAETEDGVTLFTVRNTSLYCVPMWTVSFPGKKQEEDWLVEGNAKMEGFRIQLRRGRDYLATVGVEGKMGRHTYNVAVKEETNYCIVAAIVTVFDDLRVDMQHMLGWD